MDYASSWGRDMKSVQAVMTPGLEVESIKAAMKKFFQHREDWHFKTRGAKLEVFLDRLPVLLEGRETERPRTARELGYRLLSDVQGE